MDKPNKINIQFLSDLHLESKGRCGNWWEDVIIPSASYLILAGDICPVFHPDLPRFYHWCKDNFDHIIHIPGNHEYWSYRRNKITLYEAEMYMKTLCDEYGIIFAQKDIVELKENAPKLVCATLWSEISKGMSNNDCRNIKDLDYSTRNNIFFDHLSFIERAIKSEEIPPIVITHHAPLMEGVQREEHIGGTGTPFYTNNLDWLVDKCCAWIFGHTHHVCDIYRESGCVVTSNPIGHIVENLPYHKSAVLEVKY